MIRYAVAAALSALLVMPSVVWAGPPVTCTWSDLFSPNGPGGLKGSGTGQGLNSRVAVFTEHDDGNGKALYAGGDFSDAGGVVVNSIARWNGSSWSALGGGANHLVTALASFHGQLYAGGLFTMMGDMPHAYIAKWDGKSWLDVGGGTSWPGTIEDLVVHDDGSGPVLFVAGAFDSAGPVLTSPTIAKWDGQQWLPAGSGLNGQVMDLQVADLGSGKALYASGIIDLPSPQGQIRGVAKWNGQSWSPLSISFEQFPWGLAAFDDGNGEALYAVGEFSTVGGVIRWDGNSWAAVGSGMGYDNPNSTNFPTAIFDDGSGPALYVGNGVLFYGLTEASIAGGLGNARLGKWDGSSWTELGNIDGSVYALYVSNDGTGSKLWVGGFFSQAGGLPAANITYLSCTTAELVVSLTDERDVVLAGGTLEYTLEIKSQGVVGDPAANLTTSLPAGISCTYTSLAAGGAAGNTTAGSGNLAEILQLPNGSTVTYTFQCGVPVGTTGNLVATATVTPSVAEAFPADNSATESTASALFLDGFESGNTAAWSFTLP